MVLVREIGDFRRFEHPCKLMAYVGLVPTEHSSGGSRRQGSITKAGNSRVRHVLRWARRARRRAHLFRKHSQIAAVAVARELAGFV